jgi:hypothetical protein
MKLPGEDELRDHLRTVLAQEFQVATDLLNLGLSVFHPTTRTKPEAEMEHLELWPCLGIIAKACRQYRGIALLAEYSLGDVAASNGRMLLETMLAARFLMLPSVTLKQNGKPVPDIAGQPITPALRTKLYLASEASDTVKALKAMAKDMASDKESDKQRMAEAVAHADQ